MDTNLVVFLAAPVAAILLLAFLYYRKYRRDSVIHNCSQGCHHKNVKTGSGIGTTTHDIVSTASSHGQQHKPAVKSSRGRNSGSSTASKRHEKNHTHPWLVSSLKGHTDEVRDIEFSSDGKYLASCADDNNAGHRNSTASDLTDDVSSSSNEDLPAIVSSKQTKKTQKSGRSRRQKKTHRTITMVDLDDESKENRQPTNLYTATLRKSTKSAASPLSVTNEISNQPEMTFLKVERRLVKIGHFQCYISAQQEIQLVKILNDHYAVPENDLKRYGYPVEIDDGDGTEIFKPPFGRWIAPRKTWEDYDSNANQVSGDSGQGSSSPNSTDSETLEDEGSERNSPLYTYCDQSLSKQCDRCKRPFLVTANGEYLTQEECVFHWGRISTMYIPHLGCVSQYMCCNGPTMSEGCTRGKAHVWSGLSFGVNGPFHDFFKTEEKSNKERQVYALDCEMCFTGLGLELAKITVVSVNGEIVYEHYVQPRAPVVDYNTRFSGISEKHLRHGSVKTFAEVQKDLLNLFSADTVLIGHSLENDLRALRLVHKNIVDTSILFPHNQGYPYKRKLKHLTRQILRREIQTDSNGHSSLEDSRACLELALWKVRKEHAFFQTVQ